jgi:diguanylate cyclase (GGDEF)-like protein
MTELVACPTCGGRGVVDSTSTGTPVEERTLRDRDQTLSDEDQTWSDHDQTGSDRDQRSADEDQQASDEDFAAGGDATTHERTTSARARTEQDRDSVAGAREETAHGRLRTAEDRDRLAESRDRHAERRDVTAGPDVLSDDATNEDILLRAERDRARAAADRAKAADDRSRASADRQEAAHDRAEATRANAEARQNLVLAATDEVTGAWTRKFGLAGVTREIERAHRTGGRLTLAFIDVDGLKRVNDEHGHAAGDRVLKLVVETLRSNLRPYDVIVRYGGDEFVCAMPNLSVAAARERMDRIATLLTAANEGHSITFGLAEHEPADGLAELISRADAGLLEIRRAREDESSR